MDPYRNKNFFFTLLFLLFLAPGNLLAATIILHEDFITCQIPVDWDVQDLLEHEGGSCGWQWRINEPLEDNYTGGGGDEGCFVLANSDECGVGTSIDTVLSMPSLDCSDLTKTSLSFKYDAYDKFGTSFFTVEVSTNGGSNWAAVWQPTESEIGSYKTATVDISTYADGASSVLIRFRYTASYDWWWQIDDVTVSADEKNKFNWLLFMPAITTGPKPAS